MLALGGRAAAGGGVTKADVDGAIKVTQAGIDVNKSSASAEVRAATLAGSFTSSVSQYLLSYLFLMVVDLLLAPSRGFKRRPEL